jgi:AbrB family looped-hinge helix DNA binding protein
MTAISARGQIVIPKYFREALGWTAESEVRFQIEENRLIVERKESIADELERMANELKIDLKGKTDFDDEYDEGIRKKYRRMGLKF